MPKIISTFDLLKEGAIIGFVLLIIFVLVHIFFMAIAPEFSMDHGGMFVAVFIAGAFTHIAFEYSGSNEQFAKTRI